MNKKGFAIIYPIAAVLIIAASALGYANYKKPVEENLGATTLKVPNGGTGATTFTAGECLVGNGTGAISSQACGGTADLATAQLGQIGDVSTTTLANGYVLKYNGSIWESVATSSLGLGGSGGGTVTSVDMSVPTGLSISGNPITGAGTLALTVTGGYEIPKAASTSNWDSAYNTVSAGATNWNTAYGWGNHAGLYDILGQATSTLSIHNATYNHTNYDTAYSWGNHSGIYDFLGQATSTLTSHTTTYNHDNFNTAYTNASTSLYNIFTTQASSTATYQLKGNYITLTSLSGDSPITYNNSTGHIGFDGSAYLTQALATSTYTTQASSTATYLSIASWNASTTKLNLRAGTADALTSNPSDCGAGTVATAIDASGNLTCSITPLVSGGTLTTNYHCRYDGTGIDCDRLEDASGACAANSVCMGGHTHVGVNETYGSGWDGDTATPEKDDVYDWGHLLDTNDNGSANNLDTDAVDAITEIAAALKDGSGACASGLICLGDHTHTLAELMGGTAGANAYDFGGALSFEIPNGASIFTNTTGQCAIDTTSGQLRCNTGSATSTFVSDQKWKPNIASSSMITYGGSQTATTTIYIPMDERAFTIYRVMGYTDTGTSTMRISCDGTNWSELYFIGSGTNYLNDTTITNGSCAANSKPRMEILTAYSGAPNQILPTIKYHYDAD